MKRRVDYAVVVCWLAMLFGAMLFGSVMARAQTSPDCRILTGAPVATTMGHLMTYDRYGQSQRVKNLVAAGVFGIVKSEIPNVIPARYSPSGKYVKVTFVTGDQLWIRDVDLVCK